MIPLTQPYQPLPLPGFPVIEAQPSTDELSPSYQSGAFNRWNTSSSVIGARYEINLEGTDTQQTTLAQIQKASTDLVQTTASLDVNTQNFMTNESTLLNNLNTLTHILYSFYFYSKTLI